MVLSLDELRREERELDLSLSLSDLQNDDGSPLAPTPLTVRGSAGPGPAGVELSARVEGRLSLSCGRCLEPGPWPLSVRVELILVDASEFGGEEARVGPEDATIFHAEGGKADLRAILREQIHLNLPLKHVCRPDCLGLCPSCGGNRNSIECGCRSAEIDPRLAPLARFKQSDDDQGGK